ncbi:hypothetical protein ACFYZ9_38495 [Streptomyces sp. NPDC001691]|uniref:hypothetical protein n=1 Tax=Streptomyces sp. NPDC001691 TaxID=3364600 RepID=UPI0036972351
MSASRVPAYVVHDFNTACNGLHTAMWAAGLSPSIDLGVSTKAPAVIVRFELPRPHGTTPARQLAQTRRFLRRQHVAARVEFCPRTYPALTVTLETADEVRRLTKAISGSLTGLDAARYRLRLAARAAGVDWYSDIRPHTIGPGHLTVQDTFILYTALFPAAMDKEHDLQDDGEIRRMLAEFTQALGGMGVDLPMQLKRPRSSIGHVGPCDVEFEGLTGEGASRLASALTAAAAPHAGAT